LEKKQPDGEEVVIAVSLVRANAGGDGPERGGGERQRHHRIDRMGVDTPQALDERLGS
jgi:hypothetical protein